MKTLELEGQIALKNILFATDFEAPSSRALPFGEQRLRETIPPEPELLYEPDVVVESGAAGDGILRLAADLAADMIVMGVRGAGAFAQMASRFGSIAYKVVCFAPCPVLTVGAEQKPENA